MWTRLLNTMDSFKNINAYIIAMMEQMMYMHWRGLGTTQLSNHLTEYTQQKKNTEKKTKEREQILY